MSLDMAKGRLLLLLLSFILVLKITFACDCVEVGWDQKNDEPICQPCMDSPEYYKTVPMEERKIGPDFNIEEARKQQGDDWTGEIPESERKKLAQKKYWDKLNDDEKGFAANELGADFIKELSDEQMLADDWLFEDFLELDDLPSDRWLKNPKLLQMVQEYLVSGVQASTTETFVTYMEDIKGINVDREKLDAVGWKVQIACKDSSCEEILFRYADNEDVALIGDAFKNTFDAEIQVFQTFAASDRIEELFIGTDLSDFLDEYNTPETTDSGDSDGLSDKNVLISFGSNAGPVTAGLDAGNAEATDEGLQIQNGGGVIIQTDSSLVAGDGFTGQINNDQSYDITHSNSLGVIGCSDNCDTQISATDVDDMYISPNADLITSGSIGQGNVGDYLNFNDAANTNFNYNTDTYEFEEVRYLEITAPSDTGQDNIFVIINGEDVVITENGVTANHSDSMVINDNTIATNIDTLESRFDYYTDDDDLLDDPSAFVEFNVESSDLVIVDGRNYEDLIDSQFILLDDEIVYADITTGKDNELFFDSPLGDDDLSVTVDELEIRV